MKEEKNITLTEYNKGYQKRKDEEMAFYRRSTNIMCEKINCDGVYHYEDCRYALTCHPPKTAIICSICLDKQYVPV